MKRAITSVILTILFFATSMAQNKIDETLSNLSSAGHLQLTSVVTRDKNTKKVTKVIKRAIVNGYTARDLCNTFIKESEEYDVILKSDNEKKSFTFTVQSKEQTRIYSLEHSKNKNSAIVTIIIKYNN